MTKKKKGRPSNSSSASTTTVTAVSDYMRAAQEHFDDQCFSEAVADCSAAIDQEKQNPAAYFLRSKAYQKTGEISKAIHDCNICKHQQPENNPEAYFLSAELNFSNGNCYQAIEDCGKAIEQKPENPEAYFLRGEIRNTAEKYDEAIFDFTSAIEQKPENSEAYRLRGYAYRKNDQYEEAIADFTMSITQKPENPYAYLGRAEVHTIKGNYQAAIDDLTMSISQRSESATAHFRRGEAYLLTGKYKESLEDFEASTKLRHWNPSAFLRIGEIHLMHGRLDKAVAAFSVSITHQTNSRNNAFETLIPRHPTEQYVSYNKPTDSFQALMNKAVYSPSAYYGRGIAHLMTGEYAKAEEDFTSSIAAQRRNPYAYLRRAQSRHSLYLVEMQNATNPQETKDEKPKVVSNDNPKKAADAKLKAAIEDCNQSLLQMPNNAETYIIRSSINRLQGNYFEAFVDLLKAQSLGLSGLEPHICYLRNLSIDKYLFNLNELIFANSLNSVLPRCAQTTGTSAAINLATTILTSEFPVQVVETEMSIPESVTAPKHVGQVETSKEKDQNAVDQRAA